MINIKVIPKRLFSIFLSLIILLGVMPLSAVSAFAADDGFAENPSWFVISGANDSTRMAQLNGMLSQSGTKYIKLGDDIDLNYDLGSSFPINGIKHLDLNGHKLNYDDRTSENCRYMFDILSGAEMYIYDSSDKKTGYIHFDGILPKSGEISRSIFVVEKYGKLVVNGGEIEAGRSKQIWLAGAGFYNGYVRQQVQGAAIYVSPGAECIINGGVIRGRGTGGFHVRRDNGSTEKIIYSSAVCNEGTLTVNDGFLKGMGDADVIIEEGDTAITTIYSGILDTHKVDVHLKRDDWYEFGHYGNSTTGVEVAHRTVDYVSGEFDKTDDSRRTWNIYGTSTKTAGEYFKIQSKNASALPSSWNPTKSYRVGVDIGTQAASGEYNPYYTYDAAKALAQDYNSKTGYQSVITWVVLDGNGKQVSNEINKYPTAANSYNHLSKMSSTELSINMKDFTAPNGSAISWQAGKKYTLRCTISESFSGQNSWNISNFDEWSFSVTDWNTASASLTAKQSSSSSGDTAEITVNANTSGDINHLYNQVWSYGYYGMYNGSYQPIWQAQNNGDSVYTYKSLPAGPQKLCLNINGQSVDGLYQSVNASTDVLVMPRIEAKQQYGGIYGSWGSYDMKSGDTFSVSNNAMVRLRAIDVGLLKDPVSGSTLVSNGKTITGNSIRWQWWNSKTQSWVNVTNTSEDTGETNITGVTLSEDTDGSRCILETNRSGTYRAYISCYGKLWYSAAPIKIISKDYTASGVYTVSASVTNETTEYGDGNKIKFKVNSTDAEWGTWSAGLIIKKDGVPDEAWQYFADSSVTEKQTSYFSRNNTTPVSKEVSLYAPSTLNAFFTMNSQNNIIPGKYTFIPVAKAENGTVVKGEPFTITVEKKAIGVDILANYLNVTNGDGEDMLDAPTYVLPTNTKTVTLRAQKIQANATLPNSAQVSWSSNNEYVATINAKTGEFTAKQPGTTRITMNYVFTRDGSRVQYTRYLNVVVPIAEFKFGEVDWDSAAKKGIKYQDLTMPITQVRSYQGEWIDNNDKYMQAKCTQAAYLANGIAFGTNETVEYNQSVRVQFKAAAKDGYRLYLKPDSYGAYVADTSNVKTHAVGSTAMDSALKLGYNFTFGYGGEYKSGLYGYDSPSLCGILIPVVQSCIKNPNARYVDTVSVTTAEPREGDSRYQGDPDAYLAPGGDANMMNVKVLTLMNDGNPITVNQSLVNKVSSVQGNGTPYEPISYSDYTANMSECFGSVLGTSTKPETAQALTAPRYEAATYYHNLILNAKAADSEGKTVYFDPDVKLFVNGHPVELVINGYNGAESGYGASRLEVRYYYVSDPSPAFVSGTVSGLTAPATGETPVTADELSVNASRADETVSNEALYVSRLTWYVDADKDGEFDEGEEADALTSDGKFKPDTAYSAYIELAANENMGRIDNLSFTLKLNTGATNPVILNTTSANGSYKFSKTLPPPGVTVSGNAVSFGTDSDDVTLCLVESGASEPSYECVVKGKNAAYSISGVLPGNYTLRVMKKNHVTREYAVTVGTQDTVQDVKIHLKGDVDGNGRVNIKDLNAVKAHINETAILSDYAFKCADIDENGKVNVRDSNSIKAHINETKPLW